jgi:hypothetical protein
MGMGLSYASKHSKNEKCRKHRLLSNSRITYMEAAHEACDVGLLDLLRSGRPHRCWSQLLLWPGAVYGSKQLLMKLEGQIWLQHVRTQLLPCLR